MLANYTQEGYRVIALSYKKLPEALQNIQTLKREDVESDLIFLGLLVLENKMKDETNTVIKTLQECEVATIMATGDNVLTAISIARQCGMIAKLDLVYLGDIAIDEQTSEPYISWTTQGQAESTHG